MDIELLLDHVAPPPGTPLTLRALLRISGQAPESTDRTPLNLALVLDRSGSMGGEKLANAREAAAMLVRRIWPDDTVSVVAYGSDVTTLAAGARGDAHEQAEARIRGIRTAGTTNLSGGWLRGRALTGESHLDAGVNRIVLLTDGLANEGLTDPDTLTGLCAKARSEGITTTTIGFGEEFDEDLLRAMADAGGGSAYYIENPDQAPGIFEEEVEGLLSLAAQNVSVEITSGSGTALASVRHSYPSTPTDHGMRLDVGDLYAREPRLVLMEFRLGEAFVGDEVDVAGIRVQGHVLNHDGGVEQRQIDLPVRLRVGDGPLVEPEVRRVALQLDARDARERAIGHQEQGKWTRAREVLVETADRIVAERPDDPDVENEAARLRESALQMDMDVWTTKERKYMLQEAHDLGRARAKARTRYQR